MASAEIPRCRGCGDPVPSTSVGRRRLAGSAINNLKVSSVWTGLLHEKLDQVSLSVDTEEASSSGYMCKKCFSSFLSLYDVNHKLLDMKHKLLECMDEAIKHINTVTKVPSSLDTAASFGASSVDPGNSSGDAVAGSPSTSLLGKRQADSSELSVAHKRPRIQYNAPPTTSSSPDVQIHVGYARRPRNYNLTPSRKNLGKAVARGSKLSIALKCLEDDQIRQHIVRKIGQLVRCEIAKLCSHGVKSVLHSQNRESLMDFKWDMIIEEMKCHVPLLLEILKSCTSTRRPRANRYSVIAMCVAMICKVRCSDMSLVHKVLSLILYAGHCSKKVFTRFHKLGISMSHKSTIRLLDKLGQDHDMAVHKWRTELLTHLQANQASCSTLDLAPADDTSSVDPSSSSESEEHDHDSSSTDIDQDFDISFLSTEMEPTHEDTVKVSVSTSLSTPLVDIVECEEPHSPVLSSVVISSEASRDTEQSPSHDPSTQSEDTLPPICEWCGMKIVGDNIDKHVRCRQMRLDKQNESLHYIHSFAVKDRVNLHDVSDIPPTTTPSISTVLPKLLPSKDDDAVIYDEFAILLARMMCDNMQYFKEDYGDVVQRHIPHKHQEEMSAKSEVIPLGVILKNENKKSEMIEIMETHQQYVPLTEDETDQKAHQVLFGGDQLTVARARGCAELRLNSDTLTGRLKTLVPVAEDWHTLVTLLTVIWKQLYNTSSVADFGTLVQLRNIINRRNVVSDPKEDVNACDDFFTLVVTCHFLVVVMKKLGMSELDDIPTQGDFTLDSWMKSDGDRKSDLYHFCQEIITEHVHLSLNSTAADDMDDKVQSYANEVMGLGMLYLNYKDAIKEGDGPRVLNIWKYLLPIFKVSNRRNYSIEVLLTLYNCHFVYTPRQTEQLVWSRFVNTHGLPAKNIAADLHMEHLNRLCKESIKGLGANKTPVAITRIGKAMGPMHKVLQNFDDSVLYNAPSQKHKAASAEKDRNKIISQLRSVLSEHRNRSHSCFPNFQRVSDRLNQKNLQKWIMEHVESWQSSK